MTQSALTQTALILGARGKIGRHFTQAFRAAGWQTKLYTRGTDMNAAAQGCDVIVNGLNPPNYHDWDNLLPAITTQVLEAAKASGAMVLLPGNVYVYGTQNGPWSEDTPHRPVARKGRIRAEIEARYKAAAKDGTQVLILRAGDFIDPDSNEDMMGLALLRSLDKGVVTALGDPDVTRAYAYLPDMARAGVKLVEKRATLPAYSDVPFEGLAFSTTELKTRLESLTGRSLKLTRFPWWAMKLASPFWELGREMAEMRYLFDTPHSLSGRRMAELLPEFQPTPMGEVLRRVLARHQGFAAAA
ncbi:NAD-dependent epimerase/dehydratase family protein [Cereibacter sphaeroides]|nr:NAD-dependent epimerase/dehydratase family protein [Cereibacter sphaeroides]